MSPVQITFSLISVVIVIIGAYYATYYIGVKASGRSKNRIRNNNIRIIDRFAISRDKGFYLIEIGEKVYIIGVTNQSMTVLDTLDAAAFSEAAAERRDTEISSFTKGGNMKSRLTNRLAAFMAARMGGPPVNGGPGTGESFADSMRKARETDTGSEKDTSGRPEHSQPEHEKPCNADNIQVGQPDDPEGDQ